MKDDRVYLLHIRDAIRQIREYTTAGKDPFLKAVVGLVVGNGG